jgi:hypothetical protein
MPSEIDQITSSVYCLWDIPSLHWPSPRLNHCPLMKKLLALVLCMSSGLAHADWFYKLAGYTCDAKNNQLLLTYDGAYNEEGEAMLAHKTKTQWDPWSLVTTTDDGDHIKSRKTAHGSCKLSDGIYQVEIRPVPGNSNIQGRCGAWATAGARVMKGNKAIYSISSFESDCLDTDTPVTTRVVIQAGKPAEVRTVKGNDFYKEAIKNRDSIAVFFGAA